MPRKPRTETDKLPIHVYARGNARQAIFLDDDDRERYLDMLGGVVRRASWRCLAYCLMTNHVHVLLETPRANLAAGMQALHGRYAAEFNRRHRRTGHLFQGRYGSRLIRDDVHLWTTVAYIARNPVDAGLCTRPDHWPWSSHTIWRSRRSAPDWMDHTRLLSHLEHAGGDPLSRYDEAIGV